MNVEMHLYMLRETRRAVDMMYQNQAAGHTFAYGTDSTGREFSVIIAIVPTQMLREIEDILSKVWKTNPAFATPKPEEL